MKQQKMLHSEKDPDEIAPRNEDTMGFAATKPKEVRNSRNFVKDT